MDTEQGTLAGTNQARRSIAAACLTVALYASALTFLVDGALRAITILAAVASAVAAFRGLPEALVDIAARRRGAVYFKFFSFALPLGAIIVSMYLVWLFWRIRSSSFLGDLPLELLVGLLVIASLINLAVVAVNAFSSD